MGNPLKSSLQAFLLQSSLLDAGFLASGWVYYQTLASYSVRESLLLRASGGGIGQAESILALPLLFWILPVILYSFFKGIKLSLLASGKLNVIGQAGEFFSINLFFAFLGFVAFAGFEWMGEMMQEPAGPIAAGLILLLTFTFLGIWVCITHSLLIREQPHPVRTAHSVWTAHPARAALSTSIAWKKSLPYLCAAIGISLLINACAYLLLNADSSTTAVIGWMIISAMAPMTCINGYQWSLSH